MGGQICSPHPDPPAELRGTGRGGEGQGQGGRLGGFSGPRVAAALGSRARLQLSLGSGCSRGGSLPDGVGVPGNGRRPALPTWLRAQEWCARKLRWTCPGLGAGCWGVGSPELRKACLEEGIPASETG